MGRIKMIYKFLYPLINLIMNQSWTEPKKREKSG